MKNTYTLERRSDGNIWVNLQPLMHDIQTNYDSLLSMDTSKFTQDDLDVLELKKLGMHSVYQFIGALVMEHKLKEEFIQQATSDELVKQIAEGTELMTKAFH
jgi:hypothetical protein